MYGGWGKEKSVEEVDEFFLHVLVDVAVAGEGFASFFVTAEWADKIGVFDFLVEIADECAPGEVAADDFVDGAFLFCPGRGIEDSHHAVNSADGEYLCARIGNIDKCNFGKLLGSRSNNLSSSPLPDNERRQGV